jgi:hypothetical protein
MFSESWPTGRAEQAKLTACRKVVGMYRRDSAKSREKGPKNRYFWACPVAADG